MEWGLQQADELGLETFLESTECGEALYAGNGFTVLKEIELEPIPPEDETELKDLQKKLYFHGYLMSRPPQ